MRLSVALLRDVEAERRAKERAEAPTVKTEEQQRRDDEAATRDGDKGRATAGALGLHKVWRRRFRPLPEAKAVDLFADVIGDAFILGVAGGLIMYETWKAARKPDANRERIDELERRLEELRLREDELAVAEERQRCRVEALEEALRRAEDPETKRPLLQLAA